MKPRLIKFTCPACNARLAVPDAMAGMEDSCPKCGARISAPLPEPDPADDPKPEADPAKPRHSILDAVLHAPEPAKAPQRATKSQEEPATPEAREASRSVLFDEFLSTAPTPPMETAPEIPSGTPPKSTSKRSTARAPVRAPEIEPPAPSPPTMPPVPGRAPGAAPEPPTLREIVSAAEPKPVTPPPAPAMELPPPPTSESPETRESGIGSGESTAEQTDSPSPAVSRHVIPSLGVGLMQVEDRPMQNPQRRRHRAVVLGIVLFLLFDAAVFCWIFRYRIFEWWHDRQSVAAAERPAATPSSDHPPGPATRLKPAETAAGTTAGKDAGQSLTSQPPAQPAIEPQKPVPELIPQAPPPAKTADAPPPADLPPASPTVATTTGAQPSPGPREVGEVPGKKEFSAAQIGPPLTPSPTAPDLSNSPLMTPAARELLTSLDVPLLTTPKPAETAAAAATDNPTGKMEIPSPPTGSPAAGVPEAAGKPATPEPAQAPPATPAGEAPPTPAKIVETGITPASRGALAALKSFLAAPTWQERLRWVQKPESVKAAMEKHYRRHPDGPVNVARIDFIERYPARSGNPPYCMFEANGGDLKKTILVLVEERSKADFRVDWEAFAEFKDQLLREFLGKAGSPPGKFRVMIRRSHSFDKRVPDLDRKDSFELSQPGIDTTGSAYSVKGATVSRALSQQLGWGESIAVTVQLAWRGEGDRSWVEIAAVPTFGWRG